MSQPHKSGFYYVFQKENTREWEVAEYLDLPKLWYFCGTDIIYDKKEFAREYILGDRVPDPKLTGDKLVPVLQPSS